MWNKNLHKVSRKSNRPSFLGKLNSKLSLFWQSIIVVIISSSSLTHHQHNSTKKPLVCTVRFTKNFEPSTEIVAAHRNCRIRRTRTSQWWRRSNHHQHDRYNNVNCRNGTECAEPVASTLWCGVVDLMQKTFPESSFYILGSRVFPIRRFKDNRS